MKIALITDTHWGVRNDSPAFLDNTKQFLDEVFFPYLKDNNIDKVIHLGDLVDRRKYININTASRVRSDFLEPLSQMGVELHIIAGNHDTYFKNTNEVNALRELVGDAVSLDPDNVVRNVKRYPKTYIYYAGPCTVYFDMKTPIILIPWINDVNRTVTMEAIDETEAKIALGHLELKGFEMFRNTVSDHGDDPSIFDKFDLVCSGHYHHRSSTGSIHYLGSHGEFTWSDHDDARGFHILDTETLQLEFIRNPYTMFVKVVYDDEDTTREYDVKALTGKMVKVIVRNKNDLYKFDRFIDSVEKSGAINVQVVDDHFNLNSESDDDIVDEAESTIDIFKKYIYQVDLPEASQKKLESIIVDLYQEALRVS